MSLVNNMLRDLDQRRKESDSSNVSAKLMPAREFAGSDKRNLLPFILVGLVVVVAALVYTWAQLSGSSNEQQLDLRVQPLASDATSNPDQLIQDLEESILEAERDALAQIEEAEAAASRSVAEAVPSSVPELNEGTPVSQPPPLVAAQAEEPAAPAPSTSDDTAAPATENDAADPALVRAGAIESVKEAPEFTNEQRDTIAVQAALRQIADGQAEAAYEILEVHIAANHYAHQSRETYAKLLMSRGRAADANALIDAGLNLAPNHSGFKKVKARLLMGAGQLSEAVAILISRAPDVNRDPEYHDLLASAQLSSRDFAGAIISYRGLVQLDETQGKWWYGFAAAHDQLGNSQPAKQAYAQAMQYSNLSANLRRRSQERLSVLIP